MSACQWPCMPLFACSLARSLTSAQVLMCEWYHMFSVFAESNLGFVINYLRYVCFIMFVVVIHVWVCVCGDLQLVWSHGFGWFYAYSVTLKKKLYAYIFATCMCMQRINIRSGPYFIIGFDLYGCLTEDFTMWAHIKTSNEVSKLARTKITVDRIIWNERNAHVRLIQIQWNS